MGAKHSPLVIALAIAGGVALGIVIVSQLNASPSEPTWKKMVREGFSAAIGGATYAMTAKILG